MELPDEAIWATACAGDSDAFALIFRRHGDAVYTQCARRIGTYDAADDLVALVFLEAWRCRRKVRFVDGSLRPWLFVTAQHVAAHHLRSTTRRGSMLRRLTPPIDIDGSSDDAVVTRLDAQALAPLLAKALSTLTIGEQQVVALCDLAQYQQQEAAVALGLPLGTVKSRLSRAHRKLRVRLGPTVVDALGLGSSDDTLRVVRS